LFWDLGEPGVPTLRVGEKLDARAPA